MFAHVLHRAHGFANATLRALRRRLRSALRPATTSSLVLGSVTDLLRSRHELVAENALLRHQLVVLARSTKRPRISRSGSCPAGAPGEPHPGVAPGATDRAARDAAALARAGFRLLWRWRSAPRSREPRVSPETVALIQRMAGENRLWGAERIRGELLKLGIALGKRTIQRHMRGARPPPPAGPTWATFLRTHGREVWACDFLQLTDLFFRPIFALFLVELGSRRVVHVGVTRSPSDAWVAQQLREATPEGSGPRS